MIHRELPQPFTLVSCIGLRFAGNEGALGSVARWWSAGKLTIRGTQMVTSTSALEAAPHRWQRGSSVWRTDEVGRQRASDSSRVELEDGGKFPPDGKAKGERRSPSADSSRAIPRSFPRSVPSSLARLLAARAVAPFPCGLARSLSPPTSEVLSSKRRERLCAIPHCTEWTHLASYLSLSSPPLSPGLIPFILVPRVFSFFSPLFLFIGVPESLTHALTHSVSPLACCFQGLPPLPSARTSPVSVLLVRLVCLLIAVSFYCACLSLLSGHWAEFLGFVIASTVEQGGSFGSRGYRSRSVLP